ncbi:hypothetical protein HAX54_005156 [Datura stramonium]|uniref:Phospholipid/glycerol acyltransferase domain-containing protein n=1 Tax=Datura stramonium TaxID=4076 RepID=A0ABS8T9N1_DATST|nr:hypothetical protein [Datura stramonium]
MSDHTIFAPLLPSGHLPHSSDGDDHEHAPEPHVILTVDDDGAHQFSNGDQLGTHISEVDDNPYAFLGANRFDMPGSTTVDPFKNNTPRVEGVYEWLKIVVCLPIALARLVLFGLSLLVGYVATRIALQGWKDRNNPMPKWRSRLMCVTRFSSRTILFSFGYQWIRRKGKPAPREIAPIVVSNHVSYIDPIFFFYELFPTIVASESHDSMPFVGTIIRAMQVIYVNRFSPTSRKHAVNEIKRKASCDQISSVLLFPEGTTTNGRAIISFQLGALAQDILSSLLLCGIPTCILINHGILFLLIKYFAADIMFTQFHNFMEVEYLPVITPVRSEKKVLYGSLKGDRTGHAVASALNVVQTSHSYGDVLLLSKALEANQENPSLYLVEMAGLEAAFHLSSLEAVDFLDVFLSMNLNSRGQVEIHDFLKVLRLKPCTLSEKPLFHQACESAFTACDGDGKNYILEQEFGNSLMLSVPGLSNNDPWALHLI